MKKIFLSIILMAFAFSLISQADAAPRSRFAHAKNGKAIQVKHKGKHHRKHRKRHHHKRHNAKARKTLGRATI